MRNCSEPRRLKLPFDATTTTSASAIVTTKKITRTPYRRSYGGRRYPPAHVRAAVVIGGYGRPSRRRRGPDGRGGRRDRAPRHRERTGRGRDGGPGCRARALRGSRL